MTETTPKTPKGRERQQGVLACAIDTFIELGYERASLGKIIEKAGGSRSTVYQCYGNKAGLFKAALQMLADDIYGAYMADYRPGRTLQDEFFAFGTILLKQLLSERAVGAMRLIISESPQMPEIGEWFFNEGIAKSHHGFAKVLENHIAAPMTELEPIASHYVEMLKGRLLMQALCLPSNAVDDAQINREVEYTTEWMLVFLRAKFKPTQFIDPNDLTC